MAHDDDKLPLDADTVLRLSHDLIHLDEEEVALTASGLAEPMWAAHVQTCARCRAQVELAASLLCVRPMEQRADPGRARALMDRLVSVGAVRGGEREAHIRVALTHDTFCVVNTNTEVRIQRAMATRRLEAEHEPAGVAFFRRLGSVEVEVHLLRMAREAFHLVVTLGGILPSPDWRVALFRGERELASEPATQGTVTFKSLRPADYRIEVLDGARALGTVQISVERRQE